MLPGIPLIARREEGINEAEKKMSVDECCNAGAPRGFEKKIFQTFRGGREFEKDCFNLHATLYANLYANLYFF